MALSENKVTIQKFTGGLTTDFHELNMPPDVTTDEANCDLNRKGFRWRRLGIAYESGYIQNPNTVPVATMNTNYIGTYHWKAVNNNANLNYVVVQEGNMLYFYDASFSPLSNGLLGFSINLDTYKAPTVTSTADTGISVDSGNGYLFVAGSKINPFYVQQNGDGTITITPISITVRDLKEQDNTLANEAKPSVITDGRKYDLYNQGWNTGNIRLYDFNTSGPTIEAGKTTVFTYYRNQEKVYPPKTGPWWIGKRIGDKGILVFDPNQYNTVSTGSTIAALGHFILDAFNKDRATASGIGSLGVEVTTTRPSAIAFYSGRLFYAMGNEIFYSQVIIDDITAVGKCYQVADPTAEQISDLVATDGGTILIPESSNPLAFFKIENSLILFSSNGTWLISGATLNSGFSATDNAVAKISDVGCVSARSIIDADGIPIWWAPNGIFTLEPVSSKQGFSVRSISMKKIQNLYDTIVPIAKKNAVGCYDHIAKRAIWLYSPIVSQDDVNNRFYYNNVLILDLIFDAYLKYTISDTASSQPSKLSGIFNVQTSTLASSTLNVTDGALNNVFDALGNQVTVSSNSYVNTSIVSSDIKYLVTGPVPPSGLSPMSFTFGDFTGTTFHDWTDAVTGEVGADYSSFLNAFYTIAGYMTPHFTPSYDSMLWMYSPYVYVFLENQSRATVGGSTTVAYTPPVTSTSIMAYIGGTHVVGTNTDVAMADWTNNRVFFIKEGTLSTSGVRQFNAYPTGLENTSANLTDLALPGISTGGAVTISSGGYILMPQTANNSPFMSLIQGSNLSFVAQVGDGAHQSSIAASGAGRLLLPHSIGLLGGTDTFVSCALVGNPGEVCTVTAPGLVINNLGTMTEALGVAGTYGPTGQCFALGKRSAAGYAVPNTDPIGLYLVSPGSLFRIGSVTPGQVDATWTKFNYASGVSYDQTDGNPIIMVGTGDAVTNQQYFVKLNKTTAAVIWKCAVNARDSDGDVNMGRHRIVNQRLFYAGSGSTLYTINTATGAATTQVVSTLSITGGQISDDVGNSLVMYGSWTQNSTVPTYIGNYMNGLGNHALTNQWMRWFFGTIPGQVTTIPTPTILTGTSGSSCLLTTAWDWSNSALSHKWAQTLETFKPRTNFDVVVSKNKVRGKGRTMQLRFSSTTGKDFQLAGWGIWYTKNQRP